MESINDLPPQLAANRRFWCGFAGADPDADLAIYRSGIGTGLHNGVLRVRDWPLDEAVEKAGNELADVSWSWWVGADSDPGTASGLIARGAHPLGEMPVMAVDVTTVEDAEDPAGLEIGAVYAPAEIAEYVRAYAGPLEINPASVDGVIAGELAFAYPEVIRIAGRIDGRIVGTCTLSLASTEVGALYCIATDPAYRRRGIATALTREAVWLTGETGRQFATLQATAEGEPVYQNIGFTTVSSYRLFHFGG
ncbi:MAG TPA: GNAT family N-acetyltransferase [Trebonia sp.]|nr:GNAT family N-acetyltransferase [Trebonia sp.]